ncbi:MAG: phenylalanine--tRNA ligase subunit beta [Bdellovibrionales bacterium]|nr:phenylalanine--tRNA ligase subunit beta [Bdellovibrionales bacterium]
MKFSLKWLGDYIETASFFKNPKKLADALTQAGLELDFFEDQASLFQGIVTAQIVSVKKHPKADRLTVCEVKTEQDLYSVVCGAKNHGAGDKVVLVQAGASLANGLKIKKTRIRGVLSEGMLASRFELGFKDEKEEGIWILPKEAPLGKDFAKYNQLDDILFEIAIPPNRFDCLSHKGLAREISTLFSLPLKDTKLRVLGNQSLKLNQDLNLSLQKSLSVEVKNQKFCPRYCSCLIEGVEIKDSPKWLKQRLKSLGLKSINNVVDVTNFVLWDQGQPLHAFDRDKISQIEVTLAEQGESFLSLDNRVLTLSSDDLIIRDKKEVLALAGIIGARNSAISEETKSVVIEAAYFAPEKIRKSSRRLGLETDSSYHFSRSVDPFSVLSAMKLACVLIQHLAGGKISKDFYDLNTFFREDISIPLSLTDLYDRLGYFIDFERFEKRMKSIACEITPHKEGFKIRPPSYRFDLKIKEDVIEEFARLEGYDKIPETLPPCVLPNQPSDKTYLISKEWIQFLSSRSWLQTCHYSFCDPSYYKDFLNSQFFLEDLLEEEKGEKLSFSVNNPISQKLSFMKTLLTPDLFKSIFQNFRKNNKFGQIFELSPIFYKKETHYEQELHLALGIWGEAIDIWSSKIPHFYKMKAEIEALLKASGLKTWSWEKGNLGFLHPKKTLVLKFKNKKIGFLGNLHPRLIQAYKIPIDVVLAEFSLSHVLNFKSAFKFKSFSHLLTVEKDLCFKIPLNIEVQKVKEEIQKTLSDVCQKVDVFDVYNKKDERFVSFRMKLSPEDKTWTDEQLQVFLERAIQAVGQKFSVKLKP